MPCIDTGRISLFFEGAGSGGVPVLLLHELGGSSESWREVIPPLATDRCVIAVDMRCAGRSEKPSSPFSLEDVADDLSELLEALNLTGPVDVIGAALGSLAGALLAIRYPDWVRRLMMCAVAPDRRDPHNLPGRASKEGASRRNARGGGSEPAQLLPASHPAERAAYRGIYLGNDPTAYAELALGRLEMTPADWGSIRAPVLVASGADDFLWPPSLGQ